ncbi:phosphoglycolate phosphatase/pyrophosphatase PpaX [Pelagirhabdus alkalitolerans]|uniref:Phosphoglycolate phosphatase/pyrophosphatase PpaX n=1 Tax=Pelagirhabdus alkalitolerans TaxID=1612202 RepID=A0A1G6HZY1_9BACI|nr:HAD family hydrolase [Pelagirhabdus alkalitolerans]SDB99857.1 phosphoglycolate phosphatase/pyrophosphatase PpaX [Pelagirhabdus alkalitolerans]
MKATIFDFDGTLADTLPLCFFAFQSVFREFDHKDYSNDGILAMFGPSETDIIKENLESEQTDHAIEWYYDIYKNHHDAFVKPKPELIALIKELKEKQIKIGIVTGKAKRSLDISLEALQMNNLFDVVITGDDVNTPKPDPEGLQKALSILEVDPHHALFIGDSDADIEAGIRAGVKTVGVSWLENVQTDHFSKKPDYTFEAVPDIKAILDIHNS